MKTPTAKILFLLCTIGVFLFFAYYIGASFDVENKTAKKIEQTEEVRYPTVVVQKESIQTTHAEFSPGDSLEEKAGVATDTVPVEGVVSEQAKENGETEPQVILNHTRKEIRGIYIPYGVFNSPGGRARITSIIETTRINALVIDVKDSSGHIYIPMEGEQYAFTLSPYSSTALAYLQTLKEKGVYLIARVVVFQDPLLSVHTPEYALKQKDGSVWKDYKGLSFLDPQNKQVWGYTKTIATTAYDLGFDEINFDYIRYPSDGRISEIVYNIPAGFQKASILEDFFEYLMYELKLQRGIAISADIFGDTVRLKGDPGIGQVFEKTLPYFDAVAPMVYPSHFSSGSYGVEDPDSHPKEIMEGVASDTYKRFYAWCDSLSLEKNNTGICDYSKNSPWIQDFSIKSSYGVKEVKDQIDALEVLGINSWFVWNAAGRYTVDALK
jgi:hypothetical protein